MKTIEFKKYDVAKQQVYAEVYLPLVLDSQGDFMTGEGIEGIAHDFMGNGRIKNIDTDHDGKPNGSYVIESFIAKQEDKTFAAGSWVLGLKVPDSILWGKIEAGEYKALSMEGDGRREKTVLKGKPANLLKDVVIRSVSIVRRGANQQEFKIMKAQDPMQQLVSQLTAIAEGIQKTTQTLQSGLAANQAALDALTMSSDGRVYKAAPAPQQDPVVVRQLRKRARLSERLEEVWARPDLFPDDTEAELRKSIQKTEDKLFEYGHEAPRADLDSNSAFVQRGGSSTFLQATESSLADILGVARSSPEIRKAEAEINVTNCLIL